MEMTDTTELIALTAIPLVVLEPHTAITKRKLDETEELFLTNEHKLVCRLLGYLPLPDATNAYTGQFIPTQERKRQLADASDRKKKQLQKTWGIDTDNSSKEMQRTKLLLRSGKLCYPFVKSLRHDNPRALEVAVKVALDLKEEGEEDDETKDKRQMRLQLKERDDNKKQKETLKRVKKRKDIFEKVLQDRKDRKAALIAAALPAEIKNEDESEERPEHQNSQVKMPPSLMDNSQFVFNLGTSDAPKAKKKKLTIDELKEQLRLLTDKKKMLDDLQQSGEGELAQEVITSHGWMDAMKKVQGSKVDQIKYLSRDLKRAQTKQKNKGKKVAEVLDRQKKEKHKKSLKRAQNLRGRRVERLAKKMSNFSKKGHIVPGFM